jgi:HAD superfamily phosphatase (TIGR01681 family)
MVARRAYRVKSAPHKVIVLDCDQTLWKGVCGEGGAWGIEIDEPRAALDELMVAQQRAGMVLCLASKNNEEDALQVFGVRDDMRLRREHLVSWRINWGPKSENIRPLSEELSLSCGTSGRSTTSWSRGRTRSAASPTRRASRASGAARGQVLFCRDLAGYLPPDQAVYGLQARGLDKAQTHHDHVEDMAAFYLAAIRGRQPLSPYYLGGSSFGGLVAFEAAQQLRAQGERVALQALFDTYARATIKAARPGSGARSIGTPIGWGECSTPCVIWMGERSSTTCGSARGRGRRP